jgi:hypothetical protein
MALPHPVFTLLSRSLDRWGVGQPVGQLNDKILQCPGQIPIRVWSAGPVPIERSGDEPSGHKEGTMSLSRISTAALAAAMVIAPVQATPVFVGSAPQASGVTHAQWHGRGWGYGRGYGRGWGYGRGGWGGAWPFIGFGAAVIAGAIIADQAYRPHPGHYYDEGPYDGPYYYPTGFHGDPREICLQNFRTFEWRTGFYTTYSGQKRLCPYLRDVGPPPDGPPPPPPPDRAPY